MNELNNFIINDLWKIIVLKIPKEKKLNKIVEVIADYLKVERCSLLIKDGENYVIVASTGISKKVIEQTIIKVGEGISGMAVKEKKAIFMRKMSITSNRDLWTDYKTDNFISYPIESNGEIIGILNLTDRRDDMGFSQGDIEAISPIIERIKYILESN